MRSPLASDTGGHPPCTRCRKEGRECVLGGSNRGGSRIRKKSRNESTSTNTTSPLRPVQDFGLTDTPHSVPSNSGPSFDPPRPYTTPGADNATPTDQDDESGSLVDSAIDTTIPRNPSDAWQLLKDVAARSPNDGQRLQGDQNSGARHGQHPIHGAQEPRSRTGSSGGIASYRLVREGYLTAAIATGLVSRYAEHYHPYLPLVPRKYFDPSSLDTFAANDKHLLTAVLTIASKDIVEDSNIHLCCSRYMHDLISGIAAGHDCEVEAVEALLLLAEWEPQGLRDQIESVGRGEEDRAAWMHVGIALRTGYFLGLDRTAFRSEAAEEAKNDGRKRLAWASCYISDRLISVRIGKAFWSRGPGPMTGLSSQDFPSLQRINPTDVDYARIFQATLDLTQLYSNVHDVLYSGMRTSGQMMLMGDYVKYVDEFRSAIAHWNRIWGTLICSKHIKVTLQMSFDYLRLYTNAFAFQAAISQAISSRPKGDAHTLREHLKGVFSNIGSMPDARFIYESVAAAKSYLTTLNSYVDPEKHLRYMPLRFYLYAIYSAVFLYKARSYGVMMNSEEQSVREMILQTMAVLRRASLSPQDAGSRYAKLLELLWHRPRSGLATEQQARHETGSQQSGSLSLDAGGYMQFSPANDFSWLDLEAVGDYVSGDQMGGANMLAPMAGYQAQPALAQPVQDGAQWQMPGLYNWQFDLNGNLLF
jgi:Fungal specific transcription factor domain